MICNRYFEIRHIMTSLTEPLCNERPVVRISATQLGALVSSWFSFIKIDQNFCYQKKSSKIPGKIFRDVDVRPLEQSCLAQHVLSVLQGEQTLTNVDNHWQKVTRDEKKDFQPWSCGKWQELAYNRGSQVRLSNAPTEKKMQIKKRQLAKHLN